MIDLDVKLLFISIFLPSKLCHERNRLILPYIVCTISAYAYRIILWNELCFRRVLFTLLEISDFRHIK